MNKRIIGIIIVAVVILAAIIGVIYLVNNDSLNKENTSNDNSKALGTTIETEKKEEAILNENKVEENTNKNTEKTGKILIAYFSRADENYNVGNVDVGNTEIMAGFIKDYFGNKADTFKIDPVKAYPANYKECTEVATKELNDNARPEFKNVNSLDISKYDTIILGYPIWWGDVPMIINTFLEKYDFTGKNVYLFNTHEGSGNSGTYRSIKNKLSTANVNTDGLAITGKTAREESSRSTVNDWLKDLGL
jgi:flavodoxin